MEKAKALILTHTPEPERICAASARISTKEGSATTIYEETSRENIGGLIRNVMGLGHRSIAEHAVFTLAFEDVSVFFEQYLIEFRLAAYTVKSRRYVDYAGMGWMRPDFRFESAGTDKGAFIASYDRQMKKLFDAYARLTSLDIAKEDARFLLPCSFRSHIYCTMNARELLYFIRTSIHGRGRIYPEILNLGKKILVQAEEIFPDVFQGLDKDGFTPELPEKAFVMAGSGKTVKAVLPEVRLLWGSEDGEKKVAISALMSEGWGPEEASEMLDGEVSLQKKLIEAVMADPRPRELEQVNYTFHIPGISLAGLTHMTRHRIQGLVVPDFSRFGRQGMILPESVSLNSEALAVYRDAVESSDALWNMALGMGLVPEDRVYLLLAGNTIDIFSTMNARQLYHFLRLRTCFRAQWEIRDIAWKMRDLLVKKAPGLFRASGPGCLRDGKCPEGRMSCGRMPEVKARIAPYNSDDDVSGF
ncbi:FAD-dependent thymidylate synthase [Desulfobotulus mexicanus]|uniref:FAD-dependent thymidylate synthase n=1 Tax=Desulfobotulus mexicanus TaxID=2586642 RepID=A0A5Q4VI64_9BACT|nr:FAD-dependent thymidylate synthase [Desulfobotulus mexicanus]TYT75870.1 FAD-dependent thymidylate synthase [Desulfobotulus mexicanus]